MIDSLVEFVQNTCQINAAYTQIIYIRLCGDVRRILDSEEAGILTQTVILSKLVSHLYFTDINLPACHRYYFHILCVERS